jgi:tetratricopeptide (TPR) repeat protein
MRLNRTIASGSAGHFAAVMAAFFLSISALPLSSAMAQQQSTSPPGASTQTRRAEAIGASGAFLAGVVANSRRDTSEAADAFRDALRADPRNPQLLDQSFIADLVDGNIAEAFRTAERSIQRDRSNALAHVALGVRAMKAREFRRARQSFERAGGNVRNADLTISLLRAWTFVGSGEFDEALAIADRFSDTDLKGYRDFFVALMADVARRPAEAERRFESAYKAESGTFRVVDAYGRFLTRRGKRDEALKIFREWQDKNPGQPFLDEQVATLKRNETLEPLASNAADGAGEVFYGLGAIGSAARDPITAIIYMQLARYLSGDDAIIVMTLGEFFEQIQQNQRAADIFARVPATSPLANRAAIGRAAALERMKKTDESITVLRGLIAAHPEDAEAADMLGSILRSAKRFEESVEVYDAAIKSLARAEKKHWSLYFGRAIGYERTKQWVKAEPDFLKALSLLPERPRTPRDRIERAHVLNYLAYSWVDMHMNIDRSFEMLREAVSLAPEDGAIVDSLGWAFYRLGKFEDAVRELERAVTLKAGDPTINDHLGDAYWKVGRKREAYHKWHHALGLDPEQDERIKIEKKLEVGLDEAAKAQLDAPKPNGG